MIRELFKGKEPDCNKCGLFNKCKSPQMPYTGIGKHKTLIIGMVPGRTEDEYNKQFVGDAGQVLRKHLNSLGFNLDEDFWKHNAVNCRTTDAYGNNRPPTKKEISCCHPFVQRTIKEFKPRFIFLFGKEALESYLLNKSKLIKKNASIGKWRCTCFPDHIYDCWIIPLYHPAFILRNEDLEHQFHRDLKFALSCLKKSPPDTSIIEEEYVILDEEDFKIDTLLTFKKIKEYLLHIIQMSKNNTIEMAIDYETNSIKPHRKDCKIISVGIAYCNISFAFPLHHNEIKWTEDEHNKIVKLLTKILKDPNIKKIAQNIQMEEGWSRKILGTRVNGWLHDTMQCSHIIDNRDGITSLSHQVFIEWGLFYGESIEDYKTEYENSGFNNMQNTPLCELLQYNALDALFAYRIAINQRKILRLNEDLRKAYELWHDSILTNCDMEEIGVPIDIDYFNKTNRRLGLKIKQLEKDLLSSKEVKLFNIWQKKNVDEKKQSEFNFKSTKNLRDLFFKVLKLNVMKETEKGFASVDEEVLKSIDIPFSNNLLSYKKLLKLKNTYIAQFLRENVNGRVYPSINLHLAKTYRSSISTPALQTIVKHDPISMKLIRTGIIPSKGRKIAEADYGSMEVRIIACYTQDPILLAYLESGGDMHQDWANKLGLTKQSDTARFDAKNSFVFPNWYDSSSNSIHEDLISRGYNISVNKVKKCVNEFWKTFKVGKEFKEELREFYKRFGYINTIFGHRIKGYISYTELFNSCVQSSAFHCLQWSLNRLRKQWDFESNICFQIHDNPWIDLVPEEENEIIKLVTNIMTKEIKKEYPELIAPFTVEWSFSEIDGNWAEMGTN